MANWKADDGTLINFETHGKGDEALLLLPGMLGSISTQWRHFLPALEKRYRVILVDLRGHGLSDNNANELRPERMVQDLVGLMDSLNVTHFHVAGYSIGGYLALMLALNQPRRVMSLLMHATKFYWTQETIDEMKDQLDPDVLIEKVPGYANQLAQEHGGGRWRTLVRQTADLVGYLTKSGITEGMAKQLQVPVVVSVGDRDEMVKLPECLRLSRVVQNGSLLVLPNTRHPFGSLPLIPLLPMMQFFHRRPSGRQR